MNLKRLFHLEPPLFGLVLFSISIWAISQKIRHYNIWEVLRSLAAIPNHYLLWAVGLTLLNYVMLTGYDTIAVCYVRHLLP